VVFGSTSDKEKVLPGIQQITKEISDLEVEVQFASADNTPVKVARVAPRLISSDGPNVLISGAGLSNVLTGVLKTYSDVDDLNIGIPISDSSSDGLTALLSTVEKPPRNPVLAVGVNNSYAALNIANRFMRGLKHISVLGEFNRENTKETEEVKRQLTNRGIPFKEYKAYMDVPPCSVLISPFNFGYGIGDFQRMDKQLRLGNGVQIAVCSVPTMSENVTDYICALDGTEVTGMVSSMGYENAVIVAAQLTRNIDALAKINEERSKKSEALNAHKGLLVKGGELIKL